MSHTNRGTSEQLRKTPVLERFWRRLKQNHIAVRIDICFDFPFGGESW